MKKNLATWRLVQHSLLQEIPVIILYVLDSTGSSPGRQGFLMAINRKGEMSGSLGGGIMEHKFVEMAKARLEGTIEASGIYRQVHDKSAIKNQSGMICSGEQTILLYEVPNAEIKCVDTLVQSLQMCKNGTLSISNKGLSFTEDIPANDYFYEQSNKEFLIVEKTGYKNILHIIGGGHCALAFSRLMSEMDFFINVYDDRPGLNTMEQNIFAHQKHTISSFDNLSDIIKGGDNVYIVIMTFGYRTDDIAIRALFYHRFKYLGLLGSKKKIEKMFTAYRSDKIDEEILKRIHAPVGLPIKSHSPEEIAVSIASEIIDCKNREQ